MHVKVETHWGPRENPYALWRDTSTGMFYWMSKPRVPKPMEGMFTSKDKALAMYIRYLKSDSKPYHKSTREKFGGNPWEDTWKLPEPVKRDMSA